MYVCIDDDDSVRVGFVATFFPRWAETMQIFSKCNADWFNCLLSHAVHALIHSFSFSLFSSSRYLSLIFFSLFFCPLCFYSVFLFIGFIPFYLSTNLPSTLLFVGIPSYSLLTSHWNQSPSFLLHCENEENRPEKCYRSWISQLFIDVSGRSWIR